ncbi:flagellar hook-length control protein FliK [Deferribacteres bacterium DY0037]
MENMSILNLFSAQAKVQVPKVTETTGTQQGEFENVFKKYLDRSDSSDNTLKTDTAKQEKNSVEAEEPETPEEVIDNLDIPEEQKAELKRMLDEADSAEDIAVFLDALIEVTPVEPEEVLTQIAMSILGSEQEVTPKESMVLEQSLDEIAAIQSAQAAPILTLVKNEVPQTKAQSQTQSDVQAGVQVSADSGQGESKKETLMNMVQQKNSEQLPADLKEKIAELVNAKQGSEKTTTETTDTGFTIKTELTEKVITTEVKIESPKDIMKFAELIELAKTQKVNKLNIQLHPQELGKVNIELTEQAGKITGKVIFESETAKHLFSSNSEALRQQLADKGVIVENLEFIFKDFSNGEFAGWEGKEGKKSGGGASALMPNIEEEADEADGIYA